jgi:hypothetical protein
MTDDLVVKLVVFRLEGIDSCDLSWPDGGEITPARNSPCSLMTR